MTPVPGCGAWMPSSINQHAYKRSPMIKNILYSGLFLSILMLFSITMAACGEDARQNLEFPDDEFLKMPVHYIVDGKYYDVPLGYHQWDALKHGKWSKPKTDYTKADSFTVFAVLPSFAPFSQVTRDKFIGRRGYGEIIDITVHSRSSMEGQYPLGEYIKRNQPYWKKMDDDYPDSDLIHYRELESAFPSNIYILKKDDGARFIMRCTASRQRMDFSPSCSVTECPAELPCLSYSYSESFFQKWREIRGGVQRIMMSFRVYSPQEI